MLTAANSQDATNPGLSIVEAESVFRLLEDEKLIFPFQHPTDKKTAYLINEVREEEWAAFLRKMNPFYLCAVRPLLVVFRNVWAVIVWFLSVVAAAIIGTWIKSHFP